MTAARALAATATDRFAVRLTVATMSTITPAMANRATAAERRVERVEYSGLRRHAAQAPVIRKIAKTSCNMRQPPEV